MRILLLTSMLAHRQFHCTRPVSLVISPGAQFDSQLLETVETR
jgi:hypothetical protein